MLKTEIHFNAISKLFAYQLLYHRLISDSSFDENDQKPANRIYVTVLVLILMYSIKELKITIEYFSTLCFYVSLIFKGNSCKIHIAKNHAGDRNVLCKCFMLFAWFLVWINFVDTICHASSRCIEYTLPALSMSK